MPMLGVSNTDAPAVVKVLDSQNCIINQTKGDGACSVHSVFGEEHHGVFQKVGAREFIRSMMGGAADDCSTNVDVPSRVSEIACILWQELVQPCATRGAGLLDNRMPIRPEGTVVWNEMLRIDPGLAERCVDAAGSEHRAYEEFRVVRANVINQFAKLCVRPLEESFVRSLLGHLDLLHEYEHTRMQVPGSEEWASKL